jgi:hypothetical protein
VRGREPHRPAGGAGRSRSCPCARTAGPNRASRGRGAAARGDSPWFGPPRLSLGVRPRHAPALEAVRDDRATGPAPRDGPSHLGGQSVEDSAVTAFEPARVAGQAESLVPRPADRVLRLPGSATFDGESGANGMVNSEAEHFLRSPVREPSGFHAITAPEAKVGAGPSRRSGSERKLDLKISGKEEDSIDRGPPVEAEPRNGLDLPFQGLGRFAPYLGDGGRVDRSECEVDVRPTIPAVPSLGADDRAAEDPRIGPGDREESLPDSIPVFDSEWADSHRGRHLDRTDERTQSNEPAPPTARSASRSDPDAASARGGRTASFRTRLGSARQLHSAGPLGVRSRTQPREDRERFIQRPDCFARPAGFQERNAARLETMRSLERRAEPAEGRRARLRGRGGPGPVAARFQYEPLRPREPSVRPRFSIRRDDGLELAEAVLGALKPVSPSRATSCEHDRTPHRRCRCRTPPPTARSAPRG